MNVTIYNVKRTSMPTYFNELLNDRCMSLCSSNQPLLAIHWCRTEYRRHTFSVATAENWNKLLVDVEIISLIISDLPNLTLSSNPV